MHGCRRRAAAWNAAPIVLVALLAAAVQTGCVQVRTKNPAPLSVTPQRAGLRDLSSELGLVIVESSRARATLRRGADTVMLFAGPGGRAYINGQPLNVPDGGRILAGKTSVHFPPALIDAIADALPRRAPKPTPSAPRARQPKPKPLKTWPVKLGRVLIDAGHGGHDPGTDVAVRLHAIRLYEKDVNLPVAHAVAKMLKRRGADVHMTRTTDTTVSLERRVSMANRLRPKLLVSIHANSIDDTSMRGFMIIRPAVASADSLDAAATVERHLVKIGLDGEVRKDVRGLRVLRKTTCPAVLIEMGYLSNVYDARMLADSRWRGKIATAIADAVTEFLKKRVASRRR